VPRARRPRPQVTKRPIPPTQHRSALCPLPDINHRGLLVHCGKVCRFYDTNRMNLNCCNIPCSSNFTRTHLKSSVAHLSNHCCRTTTAGGDNFRGSILQTKSEPGSLTCAFHSQRLDDCPAVLPWQPQHVSRLQVPVKIPQCMQFLQPDRQLKDHLQSRRYPAVALEFHVYACFVHCQPS
jgi:hypothetical protein